MKFTVAAATIALALTASALPLAATYAATTSFITTDAPNYYRASKLSGVNVYNDKNEKIGDVSEVLVSRSGKAEAVVIGVGGFLGMGEHLVAVPYSAVKWEDDQKGGYPEKAVLPNASKEELKKAPEFKYKG